ASTLQRGLLLAGGQRHADHIADRSELVLFYVGGETLDHLERRERVGERGGSDLYRRCAGHEELQSVLSVRDAARADDRDADRLSDLIRDVHGDRADRRTGESAAPGPEDRTAPPCVDPHA